MREVLLSQELHNVRREYHSRLIQHNEKVLSELLDKNLVERLKNRTGSVEDCLKARDILELQLFSLPDQPDLCHVMRNDSQRFRMLTDVHVRNIMLEKSDLIGKLLQTGVAPILVRPEAFHLNYRIVSFLKTHGFEIVEMRTTRIDFKQYWAIYEHVFGNPIKENHVRRRSFGYINRPVSILLVKHPSCSDSISCSDLIIRNYKGRAGFKDSETLRGGIIYDEVSTILGSDGNTDALFALDPLMEYVYNDHTKYDEGISSVFHANLPGVHIPEPQEVTKDLSVLLSRDEMKRVIEKSDV